MLEIRNYSKKYGNNLVVDNISFTVENGDIFAFIGHNGAGKTTTIKSIVGIHDITSGDILIDGVSIKEDPIKCKSMISYVPDNPDIYPTLTGMQYLNLVADIFRVSKEDREARIKKYSELLEISSALNNLISSYSHGMRQKLVVISALIHNPKILVLDEPFVGLDPKASFILKDLFREFVKEGGAIFFSTHILEVAEKLCNKVAIIKQGKLVANGTMSEIKQDKSLESVFMETSNE